jgi:hypothetical protein
VGFLPDPISEKHMETCLTEKKKKKKYTSTEEYLNIPFVENLKR